MHHGIFPDDNDFEVWRVIECVVCLFLCSENYDTHRLVECVIILRANYLAR